MSGALCIAGILVFALGEMVGTPEMYEYLGVIAPRGEEALYMGFTNGPVAVGWTLRSYFAGVLYDQKADKANLAIRYLHEHAGVAAETAAAVPRTEAMKLLEATTHLDARGATALLWNTYHPYVFWYAFVAIGVASPSGMVLYARAARAWTKENA